MLGFLTLVKVKSGSTHDAFSQKVAATGWAFPNSPSHPVHRDPKIECSQKEIVTFTKKNCSTIFFPVLASARTTEKRGREKEDEKMKKGKTAGRTHKVDQPYITVWPREGPEESKNVVIFRDVPGSHRGREKKIHFSMCSNTGHTLAGFVWLVGWLCWGWG